MNHRLISIVVPVYNEADSLPDLVREIDKTATSHQLRVEVVFVDDGSSDESWSIIQSLVQADDRIAGVRFRRNFGKAAALMAGFARVRGDIVVTMDADLQDPPEEVPALLQILDDGFDVVSGWKKTRHDPWHKVLPSRIFNALASKLTRVKLHDHVCGLKAYRREVVDNLRIHGELHRFCGILAAAKGYRVTEVVTQHRPRTRGVSKYGFTRFFKGFLDLITVWCLTRYRWRPQHLIGMTGVLLVLGIVVMNLLLMGAMSWCSSLVCVRILMAGTAALALALLVAIFLAIGLVAELAVWNQSADDLYSVRECTGWLQADQ